MGDSQRESSSRSQELKEPRDLETVERLFWSFLLNLPETNPASDPASEQDDPADLADTEEPLDPSNALSLQHLEDSARDWRFEGIIRKLDLDDHSSAAADYLDPSDFSSKTAYPASSTGSSDSALDDNSDPPVDITTTPAPPADNTDQPLVSSDNPPLIRSVEDFDLDASVGEFLDRFGPTYLRLPSPEQASPAIPSSDVLPAPSNHRTQGLTEEEAVAHYQRDITQWAAAQSALRAFIEAQASASAVVDDDQRSLSPEPFPDYHESQHQLEAQVVQLALAQQNADRTRGHPPTQAQPDEDDARSLTPEPFPDYHESQLALARQVQARIDADIESFDENLQAYLQALIERRQLLEVQLAIEALVEAQAQGQAQAQGPTFVLTRHLDQAQTQTETVEETENPTPSNDLLN